MLGVGIGALQFEHLETSYLELIVDDRDDATRHIVKIDLICFLRRNIVGYIGRYIENGNTVRRGNRTFFVSRSEISFSRTAFLKAELSPSCTALGPILTPIDVYHCRCAEASVLC